ncbi:MAG: hypothetical protein ABJA98_12385 [Acidobacteriota bacterium]
MHAARIWTQSYERWFGALAPANQGDVNCVFEFAGHVDDARLRRAFLTSLAAEPMWSYRFVTHWWMPYWQRIPREDRPHLLSIVPCVDEEERNSAWARLLDTPIDAAARVLVLRTPTNDRVCFRIDHRLADANGAHPLLRSVADNYRTQVEPPARDAPLVRRTAKLLRRWASVRDRLTLLREAADSARRAPLTPGFTPRLPTADDPYVPPRVLHYADGATDALAGRAMRDRATSAMVIMGVTYLALRDILVFADGCSWPMSLPVNLRRYLPPREQAAPASLLVGSASVWIDPHHAGDLEAVIAQIRAQLAAQRGRRFGLSNSALVLDLPLLRHYIHWRPFKWMQQEASEKHNVDTTTPMVFISDLGEFGKPGETWADVPITNGYCSQGTWKNSAIMVGVSSCGSRLTLAIGSGPGSFVRPFADRIDFHLSHYAGLAPLGAPAESKEITICL